MDFLRFFDSKKPRAAAAVDSKSEEDEIAAAMGDLVSEHFLKRIALLPVEESRYEDLILVCYGEHCSLCQTLGIQSKYIMKMFFMTMLNVCAHSSINSIKFSAALQRFNEKYRRTGLSSLTDDENRLIQAGARLYIGSSISDTLYDYFTADK